MIWYTRRETGVWGLALWGLLILQFVLPFFALLSERVRHGRQALYLLAVATVVLRLLEAIVLALPRDKRGRDARRACDRRIADRAGRCLVDRLYDSSGTHF